MHCCLRGTYGIYIALVQFAALIVGVPQREGNLDIEVLQQDVMAPPTSVNLLQLLLPLLPLLLWYPTLASAKWGTLSGQAPVVIANGGNSGLYPDQTDLAYIDALNHSLPGVVISCDLQMAPSLSDPSGLGICRTGLDLNNSTNIGLTAPQLNSTRTIDGESTLGWFAIDILYENLTTLSFATQSKPDRTPAFDGLNIVDSRRPPYLITQSSQPQTTWWLNSEYTRFIEANSNLNATAYTLGLIQGQFPGYVSVPEIGLLKTILTLNASQTKVIYKFLDNQTADASTNQTYQALLQNLTYFKTLASGILVPKSYIWSIDPNTSYLQTPSTLVGDAHKVGLEVYAYNFANDQRPNSFNYTFDPIIEILHYIETDNFSVDGFFTDFPKTASEAISCYASNSRNSSLQNKQAILQKPTVISHNGNSGQFPGATTPAYYSAINAGVDYIDCIVQISKDSIPFCRPTVDLADSTDVSIRSAFNPYFRPYPPFHGGTSGYFTFDLTWDQISTLRAKMYSPEQRLKRDQNYDGVFSIITLAEFLNIANNNSMGVLIGIQNAVYIRDNHNLAVVDAVVGVLSAAGYNNSNKVILQSEDSAALARLRDLNVSYPLMYEILYDENNPISLNANDFVEIKKYASSVTFSGKLVEPIDSYSLLSVPPTDVIALAHQQNLRTFFEVQNNEFIAIAQDLESDPTLEMYSLLNDGIDGIVSDFPTTVTNFLGNQCLGYGLQSSTVNYSIPLVIRGALGNLAFVPALPPPPPGPLLVVPESPLLGLEGVAPGPSPKSTVPASSSHISAHLLLTALNAILYVLIVV